MSTSVPSTEYLYPACGLSPGSPQENIPDDHDIQRSPSVIPPCLQWVQDDPSVWFPNSVVSVHVVIRWDIMPRCHDATMPRCHGVTMPRCHDATMPRFCVSPLSVMSPGCEDWMHVHPHIITSLRDPEWILYHTRYRYVKSLTVFGPPPSCPSLPGMYLRTLGGRINPGRGETCSG